MHGASSAQHRGISNLPLVGQFSGAGRPRALPKAVPVESRSTKTERLEALDHFGPPSGPAGTTKLAVRPAVGESCATCLSSSSQESEQGRTHSLLAYVDYSSAGLEELTQAPRSRKERSQTLRGGSHECPRTSVAPGGHNAGACCRGALAT